MRRTDLTHAVIREFALGARDRLRDRTTGPRWLRSDSADLSYLLLSVLDELEEKPDKAKPERQRSTA